MKKEKQIKQKLKYSSIIYLIGSLFLIPFHPFIASPALIIGGALFALSMQSIEEIVKSKVAILVLAIASIALNPLSAVLLFLTFDEVTSTKLETINSPPEEEKITIESKRIDTLLKLGLVMIIISGILFATTSWEIISDLVKVIALIFMGIIFMGLSYFSEKKLKIRRTTKAYFILGLSFFFLTWVGIGYFGAISSWFSYSGEGKYFVYFITFILLSIILYLINNKFKEKEYLYLAHSCNYLSVFILLKALNLDIVTSTLIISVITGIINFIPKKKEYESLLEVNEIASLTYWPLLVTQTYESNTIILFVASIINIFNILNIIKRKNTTVESIYAAIISYVLLIIPILNFGDTLQSGVDITIIILITIFSLIAKHLHLIKNKFFSNTSQVLYYLISFVILQENGPSLDAIIIAAIVLLTNIINDLASTDENNKIEYVYQPIAILLLSATTVGYLDSIYKNINSIYALLLSTIVYTIIHRFLKQESKKKYYYYVLLIASATTYLANYSEASLLVNFAMLIISVYIYLSSLKQKEGLKILSYIFILLNIHTMCLNLILEPYGSILSMLIMALLILVIQEKKLNTINSFAIIVPSLTFIDSIDYYSDFRPLAVTTLALYILYLVIKHFVKKEKDLVATIMLPIIILNLLQNRGLLSALYIGILMLILIFLTFNKEEYKKLFNCSIIITIANIIVQLWDYWTKIPLWLYLLLAGIAIIAFVTYKELNKNEQPKEEKIEKPTETNSDEEQNHEEEIEEETEYKENNQDDQQEENEIVEETNNKETTKEVEEEISKNIFANFCPICGNKNIRNGRFCSKCGQNLEIKK